MISIVRRCYLSLNSRLELIKPKITKKEFIHGKGLANEINFHIFDYDPEDEMAVREYVSYLKKDICAQNSDIKIVEIDLYKVIIECLKERNYLDKVFQMEKNKKSIFVTDPIKKFLRLTLSDDMVIKKICERVDEKTSLIFLTGIGKAWPIIRSHSVLNNLHSKIERKPIIMFFPGIYDEELKLFSDMTGNNYYHGFKLIER